MSRAWAEEHLAPWLVGRLDAHPGDGTARMVFADWLDDRDGDPILAGCYRWMGFAGKHPCQRLLSTNPDNLTTGWGWFQDSVSRRHAVVPMALRPLKHPRGLYRPDWVWGDFWQAERWLVDLWFTATDETRDQLLKEVLHA